MVDGIEVALEVAFYHVVVFQAGIAGDSLAQVSVG